MARRVLVLNGHPARESFCGAIALAYAKAAVDHGNEVRQIDLNALQFDADFGTSSFRNSKPFEEDLQQFWDALQWCDHFVIAHPLWWGGMPAKLKGLIDRVFLPGKTFSYVEGKAFPEQLMKGKTAEVLVTSDTPGWYFRLFYGAAIRKQTKGQILEFCGFKMTRYSWFAAIRGSSDANRSKMLDRAIRLGAAA